MSAAVTSAGSASCEGIAGRLDDESQYVSFWVDRQLLGVPVNLVEEVLRPQEIAPVPRARPEIAGLLNLRGRIVTAVNLRRRLGLKDLDGSKPSMNIIVRLESESFSLLVDEVADVIDVSGDRLEPVPHTLDSHWKSVTRGVVPLDQRLLILLDVAAILKLT